MRLLAATYNSFVVAATITLLCVRSIIICMKVNIGALFAGALIISLVFFCCIVRNMNPKKIRNLSIAIASSCCLITLATYALIYHQSIITKPAFILKAAFRMSEMPPTIIGVLLPIVLVAGLIAVIKLTGKTR